MTAVSTYSKLMCSLAAASVTLLCGCAQQATNGPQVGQVLGGATKQMNLDGSLGGFLPQPELLTSGGSGQLDYVYFSPALQPAAFTSIILDPVTIWAGTDSTLNSATPAQRQGMADNFTRNLANAIKTVCPLTTQPGPNTLRVRVALVDAVHPNAAVNTIATYTPYASTAYGAASFLFNSGVGYFAGSATAEAYFTNAATGALLFQGADKRGGTTSLAENTLNTSLDIDHSFQAWSNLLAKRLTSMGFCPQRS